MLTITIFAAGLVCLAGVLGLRLVRAQAQISTAPAQAHADERGITLQTLIVTAVLVLMAVAAGVVIVAITNNAAEDLEQANPSLESNCTQTEVFDPVLASRRDRGRTGTQSDTNPAKLGTDAAVNGSKAGCIPVCIFDSSAVDATISSSEIKFDRNFSEALALKTKPDTLGTDNFDADDKLVFRNPRTLAYQEQTTKDLTIPNAVFEASLKNDGAVEVRVIPGENVCGVYDENGDLVWPN